MHLHNRIKEIKIAVKVVMIVNKMLKLMALITKIIKKNRIPTKTIT